MKQGLVLKEKDFFHDYIFSVKYDCFLYLNDNNVRTTKAKEFYTFFSDFLKRIGESRFYLSSLRASTIKPVIFDIDIESAETWNKNKKELLDNPVSDMSQGFEFRDIQETKEYLIYICNEIIISGETDRWCIYGNFVDEIMVVGLKSKIVKEFKESIKPFESDEYLFTNLKDYTEWFRQVYAYSLLVDDIIEKLFSNYGKDCKCL